MGDTAGSTSCRGGLRTTDVEPRCVGRGRIGVVHRVRHLGWGIDPAVKSPLPQHFVHPGDVERFIAEAQTWVSLGLHPNVCSCYYVRVLNGVPRLFAEYVRGGSLPESIDTGVLYAGDSTTVIARILRISSQIARGLEFAHDSAVLHLDMKPANVLLESGVDGVAKITDFGIAQALTTVPGRRSGSRTTLVAQGGGGLTPAGRPPRTISGSGQHRPLMEREGPCRVPRRIAHQPTSPRRRPRPLWRRGPRADSPGRGGYRRIPLPDRTRTSQQGARSRAIERRETFAGLARARRPFPRTGPRAAWIQRSMSVQGTAFNKFGMSLSDDGRYATCGSQLTSNLWDARNGTPLLEFTDGVLTTTLSGNGQRVAGVLSTGTTHVWSTSSGKELASFAPLDPQILTAASIADDISRLIVASTDRALQLWDLTTGRHLRTLTGHTTRINAVRISADRRTAVSGAPGSIRFWDLASGKCLLDIPVDDTCYPRDVCLTDDRQLILACGDEAPHIRMWNGVGECAHEFAGQTGHLVSTGFSPDDRFVFAGGMEGMITVWCVQTGDLAHTLETGQSGVLDFS
ncbi:protein kinase family protein [Streptomyces sp. NBC_01431]|uniref:protein kinase family protein n=1 Tax=Streptomyces sp. NBC_01431 TaxID=2903863 RepID=UPI002E37D114|nr:protein kinase [Streptomyces sp. NBC_01431]